MQHKRAFACDTHCDHSADNVCVSFFDDDPWMVYPLTNAHLDGLATYLLLMKPTMDNHGEKLRILCLFPFQVDKQDEHQNTHHCGNGQGCDGEMYDVVEDLSTLGAIFLHQETTLAGKKEGGENPKNSSVSHGDPWRCRFFPTF